MCTDVSAYIHADFAVGLAETGTLVGRGVDISADMSLEKIMA